MVDTDGDRTAAVDVAERADAAIVLVAAVAENGVIGADGEMPWHYPADLAHFKQTTMGHPVILGRVTYEAIAARLGGPLPGRTNVVLTRSGVDAPAEVLQVESVEAAIRTAADTGAETAYVAGGATVYEQFLPLSDRLVLTEIPERPDGDTLFPEWEAEAWVEVAREPEGTLSFVTYERR